MDGRTTMRIAILASLFASLFAFANSPAVARSAIGSRVDNAGGAHFWLAQSDADKAKKKTKKGGSDGGSKSGSPGGSSY
jgi:hypothetical protein